MLKRRPNQLQEISLPILGYKGHRRRAAMRSGEQTRILDLTCRRHNPAWPQCSHLSTASVASQQLTFIYRKDKFSHDKEVLVFSFVLVLDIFQMYTE